MSLRKQYTEEVEREFSRQTRSEPPILTEKMLNSLPKPVQRHLRVCGYPGKPLFNHAEMIWGNVDFLRAPKTPPLKLKCVQHNFAAEPCRIVLMTTRLAGIIPFEGRDKYQDDHGNMLIKIGKLLTLQEAKGEAMDRSGLVTILAEAFVLPAYLFQPYISWGEFDEFSAAATITRNGIEVGGVFCFNERGEYVRFESNDRYLSTPKGDENHPWAATLGNYFEKNGYRIPGYMNAEWLLPEGKHEYFLGEILEFRYS